MKLSNKQVYTNNPLAFKSNRKSAIDEAFNVFMNLVNEYSKMNGLSPEETVQIKGLIKDEYKERMATLFFEERLNGLFRQICTQND